MRAIHCTQLGEPEVLKVEEFPEPQPAAGQVVVDSKAFGLNFVDVLMVAGGYQLKPDLPFVPGLEGAGVVTAVGPGVAKSRIGERVIFGKRPGAFAERVAVEEARVLPLPDSVSFEQGACFRSAYSTAYHGLVQGGRLSAGEVVLIHGATGGMGLAAVQVAKRLGAIVVATGGSDDKLAVVKQYGADHTLNYSSDAFRDEVRELVGGADVIFDPVGGDIFDESMRCLNWGARVVVVGFAAGRPALARTNHVLIKGASVVGVRAGEFGRRNPEIAKNNLDTLLDWASRGVVTSHISHRFTLDDVVKAMHVIKRREVVGRVVLTT